MRNYWVEMRKRRRKGFTYTTNLLLVSRGTVLLFGIARFLICQSDFGISRDSREGREDEGLSSCWIELDGFFTSQWYQWDLSGRDG
jgi:hypothetical protein